ncbi:TIGR02206 family membrane protein [Bacillus sp. 165]|uniref:YwaF family protein n=1 Tax=Bacillus sp. 165 TaxID=1529117 RepID=UPI001AD9AEE6|nr:TIGR02206 family membrane protein [Bacillus sp. 165]MBO9129241.1 TIGR02206 family membrane protein [Bacillus sp. 165]
MFSPHLYHHFKAYSVAHFTMIGIFLAGVFVMIRGRAFFARHASFTAQTLFFLLIFLEGGYQIWLLRTDLWNWKTSLPLDLCSINTYLCIILLYSKRYSLFEILYFIGISGELQAIFTPALSYSFPHFRFFHFFIVHAVVIWSILFFVFVKCYKVSFTSLGKSLLFLHAAAAVAFLVNTVTGGNYMFLAHKPKTASLLDVLGPYPWYILSIEGVTLCFFVLLWLPFWMPKKRLE